MNHSDFPWLTILIALPLLGAVVVAALPRHLGAHLAKQVALAVSLVVLVLSLVVAFGFEASDAQFQYTELTDWIPAFGAHYSLGLDGIGLTLLLLTTILTPIVILASWNDADPESKINKIAPRYSVNAFFAWMLVLEALAIGVFLATDVFLFYVLFEATLIPIYFMLGGFGGSQRSAAAVKFLIYNLLGGLLMLAAVVGLYVVSAKQGEASYLLVDLAGLEIDTELARWLFLGFFIAFAIKAPMVPLHTWLPSAAGEATPGTAVLMVSVLDKVGTFGMIRFCLQLFPEASTWATPVVVVLAVISIVYGALMAIGQKEILRLVAWTSVSHFGFIVLGIFVFNSLGHSGASLYMFNHGLSTAALFLVGGFLISRRGSGVIADYGGVDKVAPVMAGAFLIAGLSTLSLPGLAPFVSEYMVLAAAFSYNVWAAIFSVLAIVLAAFYILTMHRRLMSGPTTEAVSGFRDLNVRELAVVAPLVALIIGLGFFPKPLLDVINPAVDRTLVQVGEADKPPTVLSPLASEEN